MKSIGQFTKALERRVFRPLFRRSSDRMKSRLQALDVSLASAEQHLASAEERLCSHDERISSLHRGWTQHIPSFLNAVSSVGAFGFDLAKLRQDHNARLDAHEQTIGQFSSDINNIWTRLE